MFLRPKVNRHFHFAEVLSTIKAADPHARYLVSHQLSCHVHMCVVREYYID
jgi:hypothetical protein